MGNGFIREIDLSDDLNSRLDGNDTMLQSHATSLSDMMKQYKGFVSVNATYNETTPISDLITAMVDNSLLIASVDNNTASIYPSSYGTLRIVRRSNTRTMLEYADINNKKWIAIYHATNGFSEWKQIAFDTDIKNIDGRNDIITDANNCGIVGQETTYRTGADTLNTPYKAGLTFGYTGGLVKTYLSSANYGIQIHYPTGYSKIFFRSLTNGVWGSFIQVTDGTDIMYQTAGGTGTAITLTINGTLVTGYPITFIASANNSGTATTINGKKLYKPSTTSSPTLIAGKAYTVWYNSTGDSGNGCFFIKASAEGDAIESNVLATKKFSNDSDTGLTGTMPNRGAVTNTIATAGGTYTIPEGYHNGSGVVTAPSLATVTASGTVTSASQIVSGYKAYSDGTLYTGTATVASLGGRKFATGTYTPSTSMWDTFSISGLSFQPRVVVVYSNALWLICMRSISTTNFYFFHDGTSLSTEYVDGSLSTSGFTAPCNSTRVHTWEAWE